MADIFELGFRIDTSPLAAAKNAADQAAQSIGKVGDAEQKLARDAKAAEDAVKRAGDAKKQTSGDAARLGDAIGGVSGKISVTAAELQRLASILGAGGGASGLGSAISSVSGRLGGFVSALGPVGVGVVGAAAAVGALGAAYYKLNEPLAAAQDKLALQEARLKNLLGSTYAARDALDALYKMSMQTGLGFNASADAFLRFARANDTIGASRAQLLQFTETIQKLAAVSGAGLGETQSALMQLGQALSSGRLQGDELRSIGENAPAILKAIADGLGRTTGEIRAMGAAGELSTSKIFDAILKSTDKARKEFASLPDTADRANQRVADSWDRLMATLGEKWNSSSLVRGVRNFMATVIDNTNKALKGPTASESVQLAENRLVGAGNATRFAYNQATAVLRDPGATPEDKARAQEAIDNILKSRIERLGEGNPLVQQYLAARAALEGKAVEAEADAEAQAGKKRSATIDQGLATGRDYDDYASKIKKLAEDRQKIVDAITQAKESAVTGITSGGDTTEQDQARTALPILQRQLAALNEEARKSEPALSKLSRQLADAKAALTQGGGGGGTSLLNEAFSALRAAQASQGGAAGSVDDYVGAKGRERAVSIQEQTIELTRQVDQQRAMTAALGGTRDSIVEVETAQRIANEEFKFLGGPDSPARKVPELVAAFKAYADALRESAKATEDQRRAEAALADQSKMNIALANLANVGRGGDARRAVAEERARELDRTQGGGAGARSLAQFDVDEDLKAATQIDALQRSTALATALGRVGLTGRQRTQAELESRVASARDDTYGDGNKDKVEAALRAEAAAKEKQGYADAETALNRQAKLVQDRFKLVGLTTEEFRVQNALTEKRNALEAEGVPADVMETQLRITEEIERQTIAYEKQRQRVEDIFSVVDSAASSTKGVFVNTFEEAFKTGKFSAEKFFDAVGAMAAKAGAEIVYEIGVKPLVTFAANAAKVGLSNFLNLGNGAGGGGGVPASDPFAAPMLTAANGAAFGYGGVRAFASGGVFTNSIVSNPTLFKFANGGSLGLMGEAGPEAIMPLKRGPDGRLGVSGGGGGGDVTVVVNDYRSGGQQAQVEESMGPDGKRMISILIRDEVKRAIRSGEMDRDMQANFGSSRPVQRK